MSTSDDKVYFDYNISVNEKEIRDKRRKRRATGSEDRRAAFLTN